jgi:hypothetical protein
VHQTGIVWLLLSVIQTPLQHRIDFSSSLHIVVLSIPPRAASFHQFSWCLEARYPDVNGLSDAYLGNRLKCDHGPEIMD